MSGHGGGHGKGKKHKGGHEEEHENHERWLVSYADMLTLLFVLFVVLYAISSVNQQKFDALKDGMAKGFGSPVGGLNGSTGALSDPGMQPLSIDLSVAQTVTGGAKSTGAPSKEAITAAKKQILEQKIAAEEKKAQELEKLKQKLDAELTKKGLQSTVNTRVTSRGVVITVLTNRVVFLPASATLRPRGQAIIHTLVPVLNSVQNQISIEGNTDLTASAPKGWLDEFDLASARACNVRHFLEVSQHVARSRMTCTSNGDQNPLEPGTSAQANEVNRRVDIVVLADDVAKDVTDSLTGSEASSLASKSSADDENQTIADEVAATKAAAKSGH